MIRAEGPDHREAPVERLHELAALARTDRSRRRSARCRRACPRRQPSRGPRCRRGRASPLAGALDSRLAWSGKVGSDFAYLFDMRTFGEPSRRQAVHTCCDAMGRGNAMTLLDAATWTGQIFVDGWEPGRRRGCRGHRAGHRERARTPRRGDGRGRLAGRGPGRRGAAGVGEHHVPGPCRDPAEGRRPVDRARRRDRGMDRP